jgi:cyclopropane-fatty-acyl-phospholipid synthase
LKLSVFQIQLAKRIDAVPLTRDYMSEAEKELPASRRMVTDPTPD